MGIGLRFGAGPLRVFIPLSGGRKRRKKSKYWKHAGCTIHHRTQDGANRCRVGRAPGYVPGPAVAEAKATPKQTAIAFVVLLAIGGGLYVAGKRTPAPSRTETVTRAAYTGYGGWPLTVDSATLSCARMTVLFTVGGVAYAQSPTPGDGHADLDRITADTPGVPGLKMYVGQLVSEGYKLC